ncbi:MAG TPA: ABC transporter permease subunit [Candidatus Polarisedimenticolia bacterium]|nr:ABC transporter permease subunit [Candidatus Polarisedimenticolia bacterium]
MKIFHFSPALPRTPAFTAGDGVILLGLAALLYAGGRLALHAPAVVRGPEISLALPALPWYALLSTGRMAVAYALSLIFSLVYGYAAARNRTAGRVLMPLLDVLQSVPILSFLPVVLLSLSAVLPQNVAAELAAIILILTSQAWNMTFSVYQSMTTVPGELREAAAIFRLDPWLRFRTLELPFATLGLVWNSMMSWAGGWFFLMAAEIFSVGARDFRLPGLGAYLQVAANRGDLRAVLAGVGTLVLVIVLLDQLAWRPILAWADRFKLEMTAGEAPPESWFHDLLSRAWIVERVGERLWEPFNERLDHRLHERLAARAEARSEERRGPSRSVVVAAILLLLATLYGGWCAAQALRGLPAAAWGRIGLGLLATFGRVAVALTFALLWTIPVGVAIGTSRRLAAILQPVVQVIASVPATALFPILLLALLRLRGGLNLAAILLMLMGTQWYLLFNVIAGASAIPQDLRYTTDLLRLSSWDRWRTLILPALFPYLVTGAITASGGAWNASIVAEQVEFGGQTHATRGVGAIIAQATNAGDYHLLLAGTLALIVTVVSINRTFWRWLYRVARDRYRME